MSLHRAFYQSELAKRKISPATIVSTHKHGHTDVPPGASRRLTALGSQKLTASVRSSLASDVDVSMHVRRAAEVPDE